MGSLRVIHEIYITLNTISVIIVVPDLYLHHRSALEFRLALNLVAHSHQFLPLIALQRLPFSLLILRAHHRCLAKTLVFLKPESPKYSSGASRIDFTVVHLFVPERSRSVVRS